MYDIERMPQWVEIGYTGETQYRTIEIDMSAWLQTMPDGVPSIVHIRPGESEADAYIAATSFSDGILSWTISASDLGDNEGTGLAQVWLEENENDTLNKLGMSAVFATLVRQSLSDNESDVPPAQLPWLQQMTALKTETITARNEVMTAESTAESAAGTATTKAGEAAESAQSAAGSANSASISAGAASADAESAAGSATAASTSAGNSETQALKSEGFAIGCQNGTPVVSGSDYYHNNAEYYASAAGTAKVAAQAAQGGAETAQGKAETAQDKAEDAQEAAETARDLAAQWATGSTSGSPGESNNAKYYAEHAEAIIEEAITEATAAAVAEATEDAEEYAETAEAYAKGTRGGEAVTSDDPAYHNNAEYYNGLAAAAKTEAQAAAASASAAYGTALFAPNYSTESTYKVGDHVIYSGNYYVCNTAISTAEAWTAAHWTQLTVGGEIADTKSALGEYSEFQASAYKNVEFSIVANKKYIIKVLTGNASIYTRETIVGANLDTVILNKGAGYVGTFTATQNASILRIETSQQSSFVIGEYDSSIVLPLWNDSEIKSLVPKLIDYMDVVYYDDNPLNNAIILTKDDINAGTVLKYEFTVPTGTATYLDILDTNNARITYIGKGASGSGDLSYNGEYTIPSNFGKIKFTTTSSTQLITHILLSKNSAQKDFNNEAEEVLDSIDIYTSPNLYDKSEITPGFITDGYGELYPYSSAITTDYIEAKPGDIVRFLPFSENINQSIYVFDSDKNVISSGYYPRTDYTGYSQITIPTQGKYFRCNIYFRDQTQFFVTINTPYDPDYAGQYGKYIVPKEGASNKSPLFGKLIAYNGDSICEGRYYGNASNGGAYANLISIATGCYAENRAISGGILASAVPTGQTDPNRKVVLDIENMAQDADLICFEGGYNDYAKRVPLGTMTEESDLTGTLDTTTICGALESIFRQSQTKWIGKPICFVIVHKVQGSYYTPNYATTPYTFKDVHDRIVEICNKYAIPYYDACLESGLNGHNALQSSTYLTSNDSGTGDGTHPNEAGYKRYYVPQLIALFESIMPDVEDN